MPTAAQPHDRVPESERAPTATPAADNDEAGAADWDAAGALADGEQRRGEPREVRVIHNRTPGRLVIVNAAKQQIVLAPLEARTLTGEELAGFDLIELERRGILADTEPWQESKSLDFLAGAFVPTAAVVWILALWLSPDNPMPALLGLGALAVLGLGVLSWTYLKGADVAKRQAAQTMSLLSVLLIGLGLPALVIFLFGGGAVVLSDGEAARSLGVLGRAIQLAIIAVAAIVPALLYFLFDRQRLSTLRVRFEQQIFRLDPDLRTLGDLEARYGHQVEELFGATGAGGAVRLVRQTRWPILLATLVLTMGWILTLLPVGDVATVNDIDDVIELLTPQQSYLAFGFLGAYFFALQMLWRRYVRADLRPKAYSSVTVRILMVVIIAWLLDATLGPPVAASLVAVFLAGWVPETFLVYALETVRSGPASKVLKQAREKHPLDLLDGVDLYDRARLQDEGVSNIESLAHHDLVDLLLETRIPVSRLVDWVDQAILYLHLGSGDAQHLGGQDKKDTPWIGHLRSVGIRTATDLQDAVEAGRHRADVLTALVPPEVAAAPSKESTGQIPVQLQILLAALEDDEWLVQIRCWRARTHIETLTLQLAESGAIDDECWSLAARTVDAEGRGTPAARRRG